MTGLIIFVICTIGCSSNKSNADKARTIEKTEATTKRAEQAAPQPEDVIIAWNSAHSMHDADKLKDLYADVVFFYNYLIERELCIKDKARLFQKILNSARQSVAILLLTMQIPYIGVNLTKMSLLTG